MNLIRKFTALILLFALTAVAHADFSQEGLPVPWPFPWAKECPVDWNSYDGVYSMTADSAIGRLTLRITPEGKDGLLLVHAMRVSAKGKPLFEGTTYVQNTQKVLAMWLTPAMNPTGPSVWAEIRMHYSSQEMSCDTTVPVLTVAPDQDKEEEGTAYELIRLCESLN